MNGAGLRGAPVMYGIITGRLILPHRASPLFQAAQRVNCEYQMENDTGMVVCDLGNPMVAATNVRGEARPPPSFARH